jgi:thermitase
MALALSRRRAERPQKKAVIGGHKVWAFALLAMLWVVSLGPVLSTAAALPQQTNKGGEGSRPAAKYQPGEVLVRFRPGISKSQMDAVHASVGAKVVRSYSRVENLQLVRLPANVSVREAIRRYRQNPQVLYAQPNYAVRALGTPSRGEGPGQPK